MAETRWRKRRDIRLVILPGVGRISDSQVLVGDQFRRFSHLLEEMPVVSHPEPETPSPDEAVVVKVVELVHEPESPLNPPIQEEDVEADTIPPPPAPPPPPLLPAPVIPSYSVLQRPPAVPSTQVEESNAPNGTARRGGRKARR